VLGVAVIAAVIAITTLLIPVAQVLAAVAKGWAAADAAALAAADVAVGIKPGVPCESAAAVAASNGARLDDCVVDGVVVTVGVEVAVAGFGLSVRATAGPPGGSPGHPGESPIGQSAGLRERLFAAGTRERSRRDRE
jgi:secretion/DNA translocation related TadE-like protein